MVQYIQDKVSQRVMLSQSAGKPMGEIIRGYDGNWSHDRDAIAELSTLQGDPKNQEIYGALTKIAKYADTHFERDTAWRQIDYFDRRQHFSAMVLDRWTPVHRKDYRPLTQKLEMLARENDLTKLTPGWRRGIEKIADAKNMRYWIYGTQSMVDDLQVDVLAKEMYKSLVKNGNFSETKAYKRRCEVDKRKSIQTVTFPYNSNASFWDREENLVTLARTGCTDANIKEDLCVIIEKEDDFRPKRIAAFLLQVYDSFGDVKLTQMEIEKRIAESEDGISRLKKLRKIA